MNKFLSTLRIWVSFLATFLFSSYTNGQNNWTWQNPLPGSTTFWSVEVFDPAKSYIFGDNGEWLKTIDGGNNWEIKNNGVKERFLSSSFINENTGWIVSLQGTMLKTIDGGVTWTILSTGLTSPKFSSVYFVNANIGWAAGLADGFPVIIKTTNGGSSWTEQTHSSFTEGGFSTLYFQDENTGFAGGYNNEIFKTTDGGTTWTLKTTQNPTLNFREIAGIDFIDASIGYAQRDDTLFVTFDTGETWSKTPGQPRPDKWTYLSSIDFWDAVHGYVTDNYGGVYYTDDGGVTWKKNYQDPSWASILDIKMLNATKGFAVGIGVVINTTDGINWKTQVKGTNAGLRSIKFSNNTTGWSAGEEGTILHTSNGGTLWTEQTSNTSERLTDISIVDQNHVWISGRTGTILRTNDGGTTWTVQSSGTTKHLNNIHFVDINNGWAVGDTINHILNTSDGGTTWTYQNTGVPQNLKGLWFLDYEHGWAVGANGTILHKHHEDPWTAQTSGTLRNLNSVYFINELEGWAVGDTATILYTNDGGDHWTIQTSPVTFMYPDINDGPIDLYEVQFLDEMNGFIAGRYGYFFTTNDGGQTWAFEETPFIYSLSFTDINTGWVSGAGGAIIKYTNPTTAGIAKSNVSQMEISAYPNPVTDHVKVEFPSSEEEVTIEVLSLTGERIDSFSISAGTEINTAEWQVPSSVPNGIYVCLIKTATKGGSCKLVIAR